MAAKSPLNIVLGAGNIGDKKVDTIARFDTPTEVDAFLNAFAKHGYHQIDTARGYSPHAPGSSEIRLGAVEAGNRFTIDTKVNSREPGSHRKDNIAKEADESLEALKINQINIEYLHHPDRATELEEACEGINTAFRAGKFKRFGLSNYTAAEVEEIIAICERRGFVKPSVYQGQYNPIVRSSEETLFPVLRKYNIAFYAWSPAAAGFLNGNHKNIKPGDRFDDSHALGKTYSSMYRKPEIEKATDDAIAIAAKHGISGHAAALRWTVHHSILSNAHGDSVIIGASSPQQLESNLEMIEQGPLPDDVVSALEKLHGDIADSEIPYHF